MSKSFRDLVVFQRALELMVEVYAITATFPKHELYGFTSQLRRAALGVVSNIAEGHGRLTFGEWRQSLSHARGSLFEIEAQCIAAKKLEYLSEIDDAKLARHIQRTGKALIGLIRWVQKKEKEKTPRNPATSQPRNRASPLNDKRNLPDHTPRE